MKGIIQHACVFQQPIFVLIDMSQSLERIDCLWRDADRICTWQIYCGWTGRQKS